MEHRCGRNRYEIQAHLPLQETIGRQRTIGEVLELLVDTNPPSEAEETTDDQIHAEAGWLVAGLQGPDAASRFVPVTFASTASRGRNRGKCWTYIVISPESIQEVDRGIVTPAAVRRTGKARVLGGDLLDTEGGYDAARLRTPINDCMTLAVVISDAIQKPTGPDVPWPFHMSPSATFTCCSTTSRSSWR